MFIEVDRKWPAYGENNANDPLADIDQPSRAGPGGRVYQRPSGNPLFRRLSEARLLGPRIAQRSLQYFQKFPSTGFPIVSQCYSLTYLNHPEATSSVRQHSWRGGSVVLSNQ